MVRKTAVAVTGAPENTEGYEHAHDGDITVWWRQRLALRGGDGYATNRVWPRRLTVDAGPGGLVAAGVYRD